MAKECALLKISHAIDSNMPAHLVLWEFGKGQAMESGKKLVWYDGTISGKHGSWSMSVAKAGTASPYGEQLTQATMKDYPIFRWSPDKKNFYAIPLVPRVVGQGGQGHEYEIGFELTDAPKDSEIDEDQALPPILVKVGDFKANEILRRIVTITYEEDGVHAIISLNNNDTVEAGWSGTLLFGRDPKTAVDSGVSFQVTEVVGNGAKAVLDIPREEMHAKNRDYIWVKLKP